jgi:hypothetical protein
MDGIGDGVRLWIDLIEEATTVFLREDTCEAPWMVLKWLNVLDLDKKDVTWFGVFDLKWARKVVNLGQVDVHNVICIIAIFDLTSSPVKAFNLDCLAILDGSAEGD